MGVAGQRGGWRWRTHRVGRRSRRNCIDQKGSKRHVKKSRPRPVSEKLPTTSPPAQATPKCSPRAPASRTFARSADSQHMQSQVITLCPLNLHRAVCRGSCSKTERKKETQVLGPHARKTMSEILPGMGLGVCMLALRGYG